MVSSKDFFVMFVYPISKNQESISLINIIENNERLNINYYENFVATIFLIVYLIIATASIGFNVSKSLQGDRSVSQKYAVKYLNNQTKFIKLSIICQMFFITAKFYNFYFYTSMMSTQ